MKNKRSLIGGILYFLLLSYITFMWIRISSFTKHIAIKHPIIELHDDQEIIFDLLEGAYRICVGNKKLEENMTFSFSINIITSLDSKEFHFQREYVPQKNSEGDIGYVGVNFHVKQSGKVPMTFNVSMPENKRLYLHLYGIPSRVVS